MPLDLTSAIAQLRAKGEVRLAEAIESLQSSVTDLERKLTALGVNKTNATIAAPDVSADRVIGGVQVVGGPIRLYGSALELLYDNRTGTIQVFDRQLRTYLPLNISTSFAQLIGPTAYQFKIATADDSTGGSIYVGADGNYVLVRFDNPGHTRAMTVGLSYPGAAGVNNDLLFSSFNGTVWAEKMRLENGGNLGLGTAAPTISGTGKLHHSGDTIRAVDASRTPSSSADTGNDGEICMDNSYIYVHTGGSWRRAALSTF